MYVLIEWPQTQELMEREGFNQHACLANDPLFLEHNTNVQSSAYFVDEEWLNELDEEDNG